MLIGMGIIGKGEQDQPALRNGERESARVQEETGIDSAGRLATGRVKGVLWVDV